MVFLYSIKIWTLIKSCHPVGEGAVALSLVYAQGASIHKVSFKFNEQDNVQPYKSRLVYIPSEMSFFIKY